MLETNKIGKEEPNAVTSGNISLSPKQLAEMINNAVDAKMSSVAPQQNQSLSIDGLAQAILKAGNETKQEKAFSDYDYLSKEDLDPKDILETPSIYWSTTVMNVIVDDKKKGKIHKSPFGPIIFKAEGVRKTGSGKDVNITIISKFETESKKESEFIENHSLFGIDFFSKSGKIGTEDFSKSKLLSKYHTALLNMSFTKIAEQMLSMGKEPTEDLQSMRLIIAKQHADDEYQRIQDSYAVQVRSNAKEKLLKDKH